MSFCCVFLALENNIKSLKLLGIWLLRCLQGLLLASRPVSGVQILLLGHSKSFSWQSQSVWGWVNTHFHKLEDLPAPSMVRCSGSLLFHKHVWPLRHTQPWGLQSVSINSADLSPSCFLFHLLLFFILFGSRIGCLLKMMKKKKG